MEIGHCSKCSKGSAHIQDGLCASCFNERQRERDHAAEAEKRSPWLRGRDRPPEREFLQEHQGQFIAGVGTLFTRDDIERATLSPDQAIEFKRRARKVVHYDDTTRLAMVAWVSMDNSDVFVESMCKYDGNDFVHLCDCCGSRWTRHEVEHCCRKCGERKLRVFPRYLLSEVF